MGGGDFGKKQLNLEMRRERNEVKIETKTDTVREQTQSNNIITYHFFV